MVAGIMLTFAPGMAEAGLVGFGWRRIFCKPGHELNSKACIW
jgi:hypothetical protein